MAAFDVNTVALPSGTGTKSFTHRITGLTANPPSGNAFVALLVDTTAAPGYSVVGVGSTAITVSATATNTGNLHYLLGVGVRAVQF